MKRVVEIWRFQGCGRPQPSGKTVVVIWRNTNEKANNDLDRFVQEQEFNAREGGIDIIYVNGDNTLLNLRRSEEHWEVRLIEEEFQKRMFDGRDSRHRMAITKTRSPQQSGRGGRKRSGGNEFDLTNAWSCVEWLFGLFGVKNLQELTGDGHWDEYEGFTEEGQTVFLPFVY